MYQWIIVALFLSHLCLGVTVPGETFVLHEQTEVASTEAHSKLFHALENFKDKTLMELPAQMSDGTDHFTDLMLSIYMDPVDVHRTDGQGQDEKYFAGLNKVKKKGKEFIVYAGGNGNEVTFETSMSQMGASVFSFDCTVKPNPAWEPLFTFHPWCIGQKSSFAGNTYVTKEGLNEDNLIFKSLSQIRKELGHTHIDIFKFDIEGFEWGLIHDEIINGDINSLPHQLLFELHTERANPEYVPPYLVQGKRRQEVDQLMLDLFHLGYRLAHWEYNNGDKHCIEISMLHIHHHNGSSGEKVILEKNQKQKVMNNKQPTLFPLGKIPIEPFPSFGTLSTTHPALLDPLIVYNGYIFHQEMYGYLIYYCLFYRRPIIIYTLMTEKLLFPGWVEFYQSYFQDPYHLITWKDARAFESDRWQYTSNNMIVVVTDDDPLFQPAWVTNTTLTIDHWYENRAPYFPHHLAIRAFPTSRYLENRKFNPKERIQFQSRPYAIPTYPIMSSVEKLTILSSLSMDTPIINVVILGGERYAYDIINRLRAVPIERIERRTHPEDAAEAKEAGTTTTTTTTITPTIVLHVIARPYDPIYHEKHLIADHIQVQLYSDISTLQLYPILTQAHFLLIDVHTSKPSHMTGMSMTASVPMSFNFLTRLILSTQSNALYQFKHMVEYQLAGKEEIWLDIRKETILAATKQVNEYREEQIKFFHHYMNHFPYDVPMKTSSSSSCCTV